MVLDIIIGRDANTQQLRISSTDGKINKVFGVAGSVPMNVSRKHAQLTVNDNGSCTIRNLNDSNITRVSGQQVINKQIAIGDLVELGESRYTLNWEFIRPLIPKTVDITPLRKVWDEYKRREMRISNRSQNDVKLARIPMVFSMLGGLIIGIVPEARMIAIPFTAIAVVLMIVGLYRQFSFNAKEEQEKLRKWFQQNFTCPECGHFMGFQDYDILIQNPACPYCKAKYKK